MPQAPIPPSPPLRHFKAVDQQYEIKHLNDEPERRTIKIQPNLRAWLEQYPLDRYPQIPLKNPDRILREIRQKFALGYDVLRHTYVSYHCAKFQSVGATSLRVGNSESIVLE